MGKKRSRRALLGVLTAVGVVLGVTTAVGIATTASAAEGDCDDPTITVVVEEAFTETIEHPAVVETVPGQRHSWNPQGPVDETTPNPVWPEPAQGKWQANTTQYNGTDPLNTVFQVANPGDNASWFYWTTEEVVIEEAFTEEIEHPEVTEERPNPDFPCVQPENPKPEVPEKPETPEKPDKKKPPTTITINKPGKVIKITEEGDRVVTKFEGPMIEEGL